MESQNEEKKVYELFLVSVLLKGGISLIEVVAGIAVLFLPPSFIHTFADNATGILQSFHSPVFVTTHVTQILTDFTAGTAVFVSVYLLSRGLVKVFLIWAMLKNKLWAYPASLVVLSLFILYQLYQIITTHSVLVVGITLFDLVVVYFIWREYGIVKNHT